MVIAPLSFGLFWSCMWDNAGLREPCTVRSRRYIWQLRNAASNMTVPPRWMGCQHRLPDLFVCSRWSSSWQIGALICLWSSLVNTVQAWRTESPLGGKSALLARWKVSWGGSLLHTFTLIINFALDAPVLSSRGSDGWMRWADRTWILKAGPFWTGWNGFAGVWRFFGARQVRLLAWNSVEEKELLSKVSSLAHLCNVINIAGKAQNTGLLQRSKDPAHAEHPHCVRCLLWNHNVGMRCQGSLTWQPQAETLPRRDMKRPRSVPRAGRDRKCVENVWWFDFPIGSSIRNSLLLDYVFHCVAFFSANPRW